MWYEDMSLRMKRYEIESEQKWHEEIDDIPFIPFPKGWEVRVIPPFGDAVVRFQVKLPSGTTKSVYLDSRSSLGFFGGIDVPTPYWEVYPVNDDTGRCHRGDIEGLLDLIATEEIVSSPFNWLANAIQTIFNWFKK